MDKIKAKMRVKQQFESMKTQHGGLTGTEDTGYNDDDMAAFVKRDAPPGLDSFVGLESDRVRRKASDFDDIIVAIEEDDFEVNEYELLL